MKRILLFLNQNAGEKGQKFFSIVQDKLNGAKIIVCPDIQSLLTRLKHKTYMGKQIIVLFLDNLDHLNTFQKVKDVFVDQKIVIVLPDNHQENINSIHKLYPRYFTFIDNKYDDLCEVLNKMIVQ